jgi:hypothetical protein
MQAPERHYRLAVRTEARPVRIAFLFTPNTPMEMLLDVIEWSHEVWGGRFFPIVPVVDGGIPKPWNDLLDATDPDVLCLLEDFPRAFVEDLDRRLRPFDIEPLERLSNGTYRPPFSKLHRFATSTASIPRLLISQDRGALPLRFVRLSRKHSEARNTFAMVNFGELVEMAHTDAVFSTEHTDTMPRHNLWFADLLSTCTRAAHRTVLPSVFSECFASSAIHYQGLFLPDFPMLVMGDSSLDLALAWNLMLLRESDSSWRRPFFRERSNRRREVLYVPTSVFDDKETLAALGRWIAWNNNEGGGQRPFSTTSISLSVTHQTELVARLLPTAFWAYGDRRLPCTYFGGAQRPLADPRFPTMRPASFFDTEAMSQVDVLDGHCQVPVPRPKIAEFDHSTAQWFVDLDLEHTRPYEGAATTPRGSPTFWNWPRRVGVAQNFIHGGFIRVRADGGASISVTTQRDRISLQIPEPGSVTYLTLLTRTARDSRLDLKSVPALIERPSTSKDGRALEGLLDLFQGLHAAAEVKNDPIWSEVFRLAAHKRSSLGIGEELARDIGEAIQTAVRTEPLEQTHNDRIADLTLRLAARLRAREGEPRSFTWSEVLEVFKRTQRSHPDLKGISRDQVQESLDFFMPHHFAGLLDTGVVKRGANIPCETCGLNVWLAVDSIREDTLCRGCGAHLRLPTDSIAWSYTLNELVYRVVRDSGLGAVLVALEDLDRESRGTLDFLLPAEVRKRGESALLTDFDIACVSQGKLIVGEVKADARLFALTKDGEEHGRQVRALLEAAELVDADEVRFYSGIASAKHWEQFEALVRNTIQSQAWRPGVIVAKDLGSRYSDTRLEFRF